MSVKNMLRSARGFVAVLSSGFLLFAAVGLTICPIKGLAQDQAGRKVKSRVYPSYPEIARKMSLAGAVRLEVVVAPNGTVKETKVIGGHPILAAAAVDAVKKWRFDPAGADTRETLEVKFEPGN